MVICSKITKEPLFYQRLSEGVFEILVCEASWIPSSNNTTKLSKRFIVHT
jgi:hypothetical protein